MRGLVAHRSGKYGYRIRWSLWFPYLIFLQVIWAIGWSMLFLAALVWLPRAAVLGVGLLIVCGHNLLDGISPAQLGSFGSCGMC